MPVGDYTGMAGYYDLIMTSGYYDYPAIVEALEPCDEVDSVLEIGAGTGLILHRLITRHPDLEVAGVDLTQAMLDIARERLAGLPRVSLHHQDVVSMSLDRRFDMAFSYGGVWYFVHGDDGFTMISHIRDDEANAQGLRRVADHVVSGGRLMLGVQAPHTDYRRPVADGLRYSQWITPIEGGFRKDYRLYREPETPGESAVPLMAQVTDYRTYPQQDAFDLLDKAGFVPCDPVAEQVPLFLEFERR
ncbi:MAG TPA: class I SAM-dependent methyltransferase [Kineosporiaceae bacterium]